MKQVALICLLNRWITSRSDVKEKRYRVLTPWPSQVTVMVKVLHKWDIAMEEPKRLVFEQGKQRSIRVAGKCGYISEVLASIHKHVI